MRPRRRGDDHLAERTPGGFALDAEHEWIVEGEAPLLDAVEKDMGRQAHRLSTNLLVLSFGNAVGHYRAGPLGTLRVRSGKWTNAHYVAMLGDISARAASLPFQAGASSALPYARSELHAPDVLYHAFVWLRHVVVDHDDSPLIGALRALLHDPHRRMIRRDRIVPVDRAVTVTGRELDLIAAGMRPLRRAPKGRGLAGTPLFPSEVAETVARPTADTAENRFVRAFLRSCSLVVQAMRRRMTGVESGLSQRVLADCAAIEGELAPILRHRLWEGVGEMRYFPAGSTVLQRRPAYREVLRHHILMRMASMALPLDATEIEQLLEVKDIARLYELWTAFELVEHVQGVLGAPESAKRLSRNDLGAWLGTGLLVSWADGTEVAYNATFSQSGGFHGESWSVRLRPDVSMWLPSGPTPGLHLFDAKFRLSGTLSEDASEADADAKVADIHKMHAYRDAIPAAQSVWVMYPGTVFKAWRSVGGLVEGPADWSGPIRGVGAVPVVPGDENGALNSLVRALLPSMEGAATEGVNATRITA